MALQFGWDARNAARNLRKHGVGFAEAAGAFGGLQVARLAYWLLAVRTRTFFPLKLNVC